MLTIPSCLSAPPPFPLSFFLPTEFLCGVFTSTSKVKSADRAIANAVIDLAHAQQKQGGPLKAESLALLVGALDDKPQSVIARRAGPLGFDLDKAAGDGVVQGMVRRLW